MTTDRAKPDTVERQYGHSVLASACSRWWRGALVMLVAIIVNALIQMLLIAGDPRPADSLLGGAFFLLALCSLVVVLLAGSLITATALSVSGGHVSFGAALSLARRHFWKFALWTFIWGLVINIGMMIYVIPGALIAAVTPFVVLAAADGRPNPLAANFRAIGSRFGRYLITVILSGILLFVFHLLSAANTFFIAGNPSVFIMWFVFGLLSSWLAVGWALLYRSTPVGAPPATES